MKPELVRAKVFATLVYGVTCTQYKGGPLRTLNTFHRGIRYTTGKAIMKILVSRIYKKIKIKTSEVQCCDV